MSGPVQPIHDIAAFVAVAENASFTRGAEQLGTSKSNVGKAVQRLEARLSAKLFQRTTRAVRLTEDGQTYLDAARAALDGLREAEVALAARREQPAGRVRLDLPVGFGGLVIPTLPLIREQHPLVTIDFALSDRNTDAIGEGWDIVVRIGILPAEGEMTVRKLCNLRNGLYASPSYLKSRLPISSIKDLTDHEAILFRSASGKLRQWSVFEQGLMKAIPPRISAIVSDGRSLIDATRSGLGVAQIYDRVAHPHVLSGHLVHVLPEADIDAPPVHALIPLGRRMPPKTRVVLEHLVELLKAPVPSEGQGLRSRS